MTRDEALRKIGGLHEQWALKYGDTIANTDGGDSATQADRCAPADIDDELNEEIMAILAQIKD